MRAIVATTAEDGPPGLRLVDVPAPSPGPTAVRVAVRHAGVNRIDLLQAAGRMRLPAGATDILGVEVAGVVESVGERVQRWQVGDAVCGLVVGGGYADYVTVEEGDLLPVPAGFGFAEAAAVPEAYATAWFALVTRGRLAAGGTVLVHGGASAVGIAALHIARHRDARVVASCSSTSKAKACHEHGADDVVIHTERSPWEAVSAFTDGRGVDVILDNLGGDHLKANLGALAVYGTLVSIGSESGDLGHLPLSLLRRTGLSITGFSIRAMPPQHRAALLADLERHLWPAFEQRTIAPPVGAVYPLHAAGEAHAFMGRRERLGKVVLDVGTAPPARAAT